MQEPTPEPKKDPRRPLGLRGELLATEYLLKRGYRILARNLRTPAAEIDILARDEDTLVLVEVKTHSRLRPEVEISWGQRRRLARAAIWAYGRWGRNNAGVRVDLLAVRLYAADGKPRIDLFPGVITDIQ